MGSDAKSPSEKETQALPGSTGLRPRAERAPLRPPSIPGYVLYSLLGRGAYGEVWLGENRTTRRQVAVKILRSRATLDWALLDGETEKLAFLAADRRVVQLLDVGRDADPPFFVMEYVARGSLASTVDSMGRLPVERAAATFEEIALGLVQVHAKGILHCDLKPSNILLDDEWRPRLADFGQSRLTEDPSATLALGTLFYMAPEQADPAAIPDARWDIYALGAVLYTMLEGRPPFCSDEATASIRAEPDLARRLGRYREIVSTAPPARRALGRRIDKPLLDILERCLALDPRKRFATAEAVCLALRQRREARGRRPMILLGGLGPVLLLLVMLVFALRGYGQATQQSSDALRRRAFESNKFAAAFIARSLEGEVRRYFDIVSEEARSPAFRAAFRRVIEMPELEHLDALGVGRDDAAARELIQGFVDHPARRALDDHFRERLGVHLQDAGRDPRGPRFGSMFAVGARGTHLGAAYSDPRAETKSVGRYFAWRSYYHGGPHDLARDAPRDRIRAIDRPHLSAPFRSTTTNTWRMGVSTPLFEGAGADRVFAGVLVFSVDIGNFELLTVEDQPPQDRFPVLVDARDESGGGRIVLHPYFADRAVVDPDAPSAGPTRPLIDRELLGRLTQDWRVDYLDPLAALPGGTAYAGVWVAAGQSLQLPGGRAPAAAGAEPSGLMVLVQERAAAAIGPVEQLGGRLLSEGLLALFAISVTVAALWFFALRARRVGAEGRDGAPPTPPAAPRPLRERSTLSESEPDHG